MIAGGSVKLRAGGQAWVGLECLTEGRFEGLVYYQDYAYDYIRPIHMKKNKKRTQHQLVIFSCESIEKTTKNTENACS